MCGSKQAPAAPAPVVPAAAVPLPVETAKTAVVDVEADKKLRRSGRNKLTIPSAGAPTTTGMSGLNIPQ